MHLALVHNVAAGDREYEPEDLVGLLKRAGHEVTEFGKKKRDVVRAMALYPDAIVVAGGDGTVARAAAALCGSSIPLVILPTGTANNVAQSLGVAASVAAIARGLATARLGHLDVAQISGPWGTRPFVEAAGLGVIADMLRGGQTLRARFQRFVKTVGRSSEHEVRGAARGVGRLIARHEARHYQVRADGEDLSGDYLAVEVMNIRQIGPRLLLAPDADPGDGMLDLVLVGPDVRDALVAYVSEPEVAGRAPVTSRRVRSVELSWPTDDGHADDKPWPRRIEPGAEMESDPVVEAHAYGQTTVLVPATPSADL